MPAQAGAAAAQGIRRDQIRDEFSGKALAGNINSESRSVWMFLSNGARLNRVGSECRYVSLWSNISSRKRRSEGGGRESTEETIYKWFMFNTRSIEWPLVQPGVSDQKAYIEADELAQLMTSQIKRQQPKKHTELKKETKMST